MTGERATRTRGEAMVAALPREVREGAARAMAEVLVRYLRTAPARVEETEGAERPGRPVLVEEKR